MNRNDTRIDRNELECCRNETYMCNGTEIDWHDTGMDRNDTGKNRKKAQNVYMFQVVSTGKTQIFSATIWGQILQFIVE